MASDLTVKHYAGRELAWLGLGNKFDHDVTTVDEMLRLSGMDQLLISERELQVADMPTAEFIAPVKALVSEDVTTGETKVLGIVGENRPLLQPSEIFGFVQKLADGNSWDCVGTVRQGRTCFGQIAWDREIVLDPTGVNDIVKSWLTVAAGFDGTMSLQGGVTSVRARCLNTLTVALADADRTFKIKITKNARDKMIADAEMWRNANVYVDAFEIKMREMFAAEFSDRQFENAILHFFPKPDIENKAGYTRWEAKRDAHFLMWNSDHNAGIRNTAWGAANVLTEVNQWARGERDNAKGREAFAMAGSGFDGPTNKFRSDVFALVSSRAGV